MKKLLSIILLFFTSLTLNAAGILGPLNPIGPITNNDPIVTLLILDELTKGSEKEPAKNVCYKNAMSDLEFRKIKISTEDVGTGRTTVNSNGNIKFHKTENGVSMCVLYFGKDVKINFSYNIKDGMKAIPTKSPKRYKSERLELRDPVSNIHFTEEWEINKIHVVYSSRYANIQRHMTMTLKDKNAASFSLSFIF